MRIVLAAVFTLCLTPPAFALDAPTLRVEVEALLQQMKFAAAPSQMQWSPVEVQPEGDALRVRLAGLRVDGFDGSADLNIGAVDLRVRETGPGLFTVDDVHLPPRAALLEDGIESGSIVLQVERLAATYSAALGTVTQLDVALRGIDVRPPKGTGASIDSVVAFMETLPEVNGYGATGLDSQHLLASIGGLRIGRPDKALQFDNLSVELHLQGFDWLAFRPLVDILRQQQLALALSDQPRLAALRAAWVAADPLMKAYDVALHLDGFHYREPFKGSLSLDHLEATGVQEPAGRDGLFASSGTITVNGLALGDAVAAEIGPFAPLVPTSLDGASRTEGLPAEAWAGVLFDLAPAFFEKEDDALATATAASKVFEKALADAGTKVLLRKLTIETPLLRLENKASFRYATSNQLGLVGTWVATLTGLEAALQWVQGLTDEDAKRGASAVLLAVRGFGQAVPQADGTAIHRFTFEFPPDGQVTINGLPVSKLLQNTAPK